MTSLVSQRSAEPTLNAAYEQLSAGRAAWLLVRLRFARLKNQVRHVVGGASVSSKANPSRRAASASSAGLSVGMCVFFLLALAMLSVQSFGQFEAIASQHAPSGVRGRAALLCSVLILALFMMGSESTDATRGNFDDDLDWLLTLPAPAWVVHTGKLVEAALMQPVRWILLFPFFTGLGVHSGLGVLAPLIALGICLPLFALTALWQWLVEIAARRFLPGGAGRLVRGVVAALGFSVLPAYLLMPALGRLNLAPLGNWLDFSRSIAWLPFAEPALAMTSLSEAPARGLALFALFAIQMAVGLALGAVGLRKVYQHGLLAGSRTAEGVRGAGSLRRALFRKQLIRGPVAKDLIWLRRNPTRVVGLLFAGVLANGAAIVWVQRLGTGVWTASLLGGVSFFVGLGLLAMLTILVEAERPALALLWTLPRSLSRTFAEKSLLASLLACASTLPLLIYGSRELASFADALPRLIYAGLGVFVFGFIATALALWHVNPTASNGALQSLVRTVQLVMLGGFFSAGITAPSLWGALPVLVLVSAFAFALWHDALARLPFALDPTARRVPRLSATAAIVAIVVMRTLQGELFEFGKQAGLNQWPSLVLSYLVAGAVVTMTAILLQKNRGFPRLSEAMWLGRGAGLWLSSREGLLWSLPAIAVNVVFVLASQHSSFLAKSIEELSNQHWSTSLSGQSPWLFAALSIVAAPLVEELLFRGLLYRALRAQWSLVASLLLSATVFTVVHPRVGAIPVFCMAICATLAFERSRSLIAPILVHATYNGFVAWTVLKP